LGGERKKMTKQFWGNEPKVKKKALTIKNNPSKRKGEPRKKFRCGTGEKNLMVTGKKKACEIIKRKGGSWTLQGMGKVKKGGKWGKL